MARFLSLLAAFVLAFTPLSATAQRSGCPPELIEAQRVYDTLPLSTKPVTWIGVSYEPLCRARPTAVLCSGRIGRQPSLKEVTVVDAWLRSEFTYIADEVQFGGEDRWQNDAVCGDCEDYALALSERLADAGFGGTFMHLVIWTAKPTAAHATLVVETSDGGEVEIGVGKSETPKPFVLSTGYRAAIMQLDGRRRWSMRIP